MEPGTPASQLDKKASCRDANSLKSREAGGVLFVAVYKIKPQRRVRPSSLQRGRWLLPGGCQGWIAVNIVGGHVFSTGRNTHLDRTGPLGSPALIRTTVPVSPSSVQSGIGSGLLYLSRGGPAS